MGRGGPVYTVVKELHHHRTDDKISFFHVTFSKKVKISQVFTKHLSLHAVVKGLYSQDIRAAVKAGALSQKAPRSLPEGTI